MEDQGIKIAKNTSYLTLAFIGEKILAFIYFTLIARWVGVEGTGKYFFALSFTTIFSVFIDFGLTPVLIREIAKAKEKAKDFVANILGIKLILSVITYLVVVVLINVLNYPTITRTMVYLAGIVMLLDSWHLTFYGVFRGYQNLKFEAVGVIIGKIITVGIGIIVLLLKLPLPFLILALVCGSFFNFLYALFLLIKKLHILPSLRINKPMIKMFLMIALPFALAGIFDRVYSYIDGILLSILTTDKYVGWYSVPYKILFSFRFIPMGFAASIFPAMSSFYTNSREYLIKTFEKAHFYLMVIAIPSVFGIFSLADEIILKIYGAEYEPSILTLKILIFSLIFIFLSFPNGSLLNACDRQATTTAIMGVSMVINVILNVILIPKFNIIGAAVAAVASNAFLFFAGLYFSHQVIKYNKAFLLSKFLKMLIAAGLMSLAVIYLKTRINFLIAIPLGALIYLATAYLLGAIEKEDMRKMWTAIFKK